MKTTIKLNNGYPMPVVGLGSALCHGDEMRKAIRVALEIGYRSIDTAYLYENEDAIGEELHDWISQGKIKREDLFVTSKLPAIANREEDVNRFLKKSLEALKLDYLDLYLIHHPFGFKNVDNKTVIPRDAEGNTIFDYETDLVELWKAMERQVDAGLTRSIGISNFNIEQTNAIMKIARIAPACAQNEAHVYLQQMELHQCLKNHGIVMCAYSPIGAPNRDAATREFPTPIEHPTVVEIAKNYGKSPAQVLLRFLVHLGYIVIPKSENPERLKQNFEIDNFELAEKEIDYLKKLDRGENGRIFNFQTIFKGVANHKNYPFK